MIEDKRTARSLLNRNSAVHLYFLYKNGYLSKIKIVLCAAIRESRMDIFRELIDSDELDLGEIAEVAAEVGNIPLTYELIGRSDDDDILRYVIQGAARGNHMDFVDKIVKLSDQRDVDDKDYSYYINEGKLEGGCVEGILYTSDFTSLAKGGHLDVIKKQKEPNWIHCIMGATESGHLNIVKYAIDNGADPNTSLPLAVENYRMNIIHYLETFKLDWSKAVGAAKLSPFSDMYYYVRERVTDEK